MTKYQQTPEIFLEQDESFDIIVNNKVRVHIVKCNDGYIVDLYRERKTVSDEDYLTSCDVLDSEVDDEQDY